METVKLGGQTAAIDADHGFDRETFKQFISFDVGDGAPIYYHSVGKLYRQPGGEVIAAVEALVSNRLVQQDEERKEASAQIIQASKLATLGEMATSVAHELNQPLNIIRMAVWNSRRKLAQGDSDAQVANFEYLDAKLERIEGQISRASQIIDHMRMFGREAREDLEPIDPTKAVTNALDLMGEQLRLADIKVSTSLPAGGAMVMGHSIQLEQVILNLLTNARDAIGQRLGVVKGAIELCAIASGSEVTITCADNGGGIPDGIISRIFEPFYTTKEVGQGTGLGLSVTYGIIRDMNGAISAENTDKGACFTIKLPRLKQ